MRCAESGSGYIRISSLSPRPSWTGAMLLRVNRASLSQKTFCDIPAMNCRWIRGITRRCRPASGADRFGYEESWRPPLAAERQAVTPKGPSNGETVDWQGSAGTENSLVRDTDYASTEVRFVNPSALIVRDVSSLQHRAGDIVVCNGALAIDVRTRTFRF